MDIEEIVAKHFANIEDGNGVPLYRQLEDAIGRFILDQDDNSPFPSERDLGKALGVNRRTLRKAIEPFVLSGMLRRSQKRTLTFKDGRKLDEPQLAHPFTLDLPMPTFSHKSKLRALLYENLPFQRDFWNSVIAKFNKAHAGIELEALWVPPLSTKPYWDTFRGGDCDLAHLPPSYLWPDDLPEIMQPVDDGLLELERGPEFRSCVFCQDEPQVLRSAVPFGFHFSLLHWNRSLCGGEVGEFLRHPFTERLGTALAGLPESAYVAPVFYDLIRDLGLPVTFDGATVEAHCRIVMERLGMLRGKKGRRFVDGDPERTYASPPSDAEVLLRGTFSYSLGMDKASLEHFHQAVPMARPDSKYWGGCLSLGVFRRSRNQETARLFIEFMLSEPVQRQLAEEAWTAPVMACRCDALAARLNVSPAALDAYLARNRENPQKHPPPVGLAMAPWIDKLLAGKIDEEVALRNTLRHFQLLTTNTKDN